MESAHESIREDKPVLTVAICTYNRADRLPGLIRSLRNQEVDVAWEILVVDNNSTDNTSTVLAGLMSEPGVSLRAVKETVQGIVHARNRAVAESLQCAYLLFMDDDEIPVSNGMLQAAVNALRDDGAVCVGGRILLGFEPVKRPAWLGDELLQFLGRLDHGSEPFWIRNQSTPVWSGIVAYRTSLFRDDPELRFDKRFNRAGYGIGGGEDQMMFLELLRREVPIRYQPQMEVVHFIEPFKLKRRYFIKLHYLSGVRFGRYESGPMPKTICGIPPYMIRQSLQYLIDVGMRCLRRDKKALRYGMIFSYSLGAIYGRFQYWNDMRAQK